MKKLFILATAVLATVACSKTEVNDNDQAISFQIANYAGQTAMWGGAVKIYSFKISSGSTDYIDYVPVKRKSDNKAGFWDVVNKRFITGVGTFTAGAAA